MSIAAPAFATTTVEKAPTSASSRRDAFITNERVHGVDKDFRDAWHHAKGGMYRLVVTPAHTVFRRPDKSSVCANLKERCEEERWLRELYRARCPKGVHVSFGFENQLNAPCGDHLEDVFMLVVNFEVTG